MTETCPICRKREAVTAYKPFCSKRCSDVDLNRWLTGQYAIPTEETVSEVPVMVPHPDAAND
ncbi:DNA gyrase inhibitor YacG [Algimonas porphyrae]|uniref:DNA gyrase inhibitor YacG n=1 Tax=Algimonas porphyrae TaxID=1128113 RepID=A0ABQ5UWI1_9PROT|nr:DNA gyrase inhibitor YacG [Algimonas porphyrae]GLQ19060.1 hypothetical protein GCM10007854_00150 [Algimonas porphyrae]